MHRPTLIFVILALVAFAAGVAASRFLDRSAKPLVATVLTSPRSVPGATLVDHRGAPLTRDRFLGGWDILFFGFTHCPDVCPTTLYELSQIDWADAGVSPRQRPTVWLMSVDPARDTPEKLRAYLSRFGENFMGATGAETEIERFARGLGAVYERLGDDDDYNMAHTAALFLIDPAANLVAVFSTPHDRRTIAADYRALTR